MLNSAVLFLIFNRPEITEKVFQEIRRAKPTRLYIAADGPRERNPADEILCEKAREIRNWIDWECEVRTLYQEKNLGCRVAVGLAIDWFFDHEEEGIILEDDCLPSQSFFIYCAELLEYYRDDKRVMCISGDNFQQGKSVTSDSYYFSKYSHCWGWATWRRAWAHYDRDMKLWNEFRDDGQLQVWSDGNNQFEQYWSQIFNSAAAGEINSWAYRWQFSCWSQNGLTCLPDKNLVKNIGFGDQATHTRESADWRDALQAENIEFPLTHPQNVIRNENADIITDSTCFGIRDNTFHAVVLYNLEKLMNSRVVRRLRVTFSKVWKY
jgi:hypothetical protein